jgi:predicted enzyme related to lactoylglutathione lyase
MEEPKMGNPVIWFEIGGHDAESLRAFYGELFGWTYEVDNPMDYASVDTGAGGAGIPGGSGPRALGVGSGSGPRALGVGSGSGPRAARSRVS